MADEKYAKAVFAALCKALENKGLKFKKDEEAMTILFIVDGDDIPMQFILKVDAERQLIRLLSPLPFTMSEDKRMEGAIATCAATFGLTDGSFDYDLTEGRIIFRLTASFRESLIGEELFHYMIVCACIAVDEYNDKFLALDKGLLSITDFIENE